MDVPDTPVRRVMSEPVRTIDGERSVGEAAAAISDEGVGSLVVHGDASRGLLTKTDVIDGLSEGLDPETTTAADLMSSPLITVAPDVDLQTAVDRMSHHGIKHLAVEERTTVVGVVTTTDLVVRLAQSDATVGLFADLYDRDGPTTYECPVCGYRTETDRRASTCPDCGESMRDVGVSRE